MKIITELQYLDAKLSINWGLVKKVTAVKANVFQFPLKFVLVITGHKIQGQTVKNGIKVVVNWNNRLPPTLGYMML